MSSDETTQAARAAEGDAAPPTPEEVMASALGFAIDFLVSLQGDMMDGFGPQRDGLAYLLRRCETALVVSTGSSATDVRRCRVCACSDDDCKGCIERTGEPCTWVEYREQTGWLCSACLNIEHEPHPVEALAGEAAMVLRRSGHVDLAERLTDAATRAFRQDTPLLG